MSQSQATGAQARLYDDYWRGASGWRPTDSLDKELSLWMRALVQPGQKLLDVGCGDGSRYAAHLISAGVELHGVDISAIAVAEACQRGVKAITGSLDEKLPWDDNQFDAVICLEVFQHLMDPELAAREIFRVIKPGGLFLTTVPNVGNWRSRMDMLFLGRCRTGGSPLNTKFPWRDPHLRSFNAKAIGDMLGEVGFQIERRGGLHTNFLSQAPLIRRLTAYRIFRPVNRACEAIGRHFYSLLAGRCVVLARRRLGGLPKNPEEPTSGVEHPFFPSSGTPGEGQGGGLGLHKEQGWSRRANPPSLSSPGVPEEEVRVPGILGTLPPGN